MNREQWTSVDDYLVSQTQQDDPHLTAVLKACADAGLPPISVAPNQGKLLHLLAKMIGAQRILEVGTLGGYSTIWLARAIPADGRVVTLEVEEKHAKVAEANFRLTGMADRIELRKGVAMRSMEQLADERVADFDMVFIDADKHSCADYFAWAIDHTRVGGVIIVDNVVRDGQVTNATSTDESVVGVRRFLAMLKGEPRVDATALQTVGVKGYDGLAIALVVTKQK